MSKEVFQRVAKVLPQVRGAEGNVSIFFPPVFPCTSTAAELAYRIIELRFYGIDPIETVAQLLLEFKDELPEELVELCIFYTEGVKDIE